ncbi:MAG: alanine:cation symporter family protein [Gammaproteobacteria bacterium]|jgi:AGCS family alanine or glycine:cation symporter|nr:alanine:cation symporter family protein [Gammaproteobacteria bacterium]MBT7537720.1 alanine:cation symporter family protein [Gammaproteobacteria bacterium]|tara:strand:+ start:4543 stop:6066 length:1524 start_codon:yes stop_codon:yes gene_type:complete
MPFTTLHPAARRKENPIDSLTIQSSNPTRDVPIDVLIDSMVRPITDAVSSFIFYAVPVGDANLPLIVVWLVAGGLFFTGYLGFINVRGFRHGLALATGRYQNPNAPGEVTQFQALATAVSGTVGVGNIAGVAIAISLGGPGATFWLIVAGLLGMSTKFAECTLAVRYRKTNPDGSVSGGPMYYLEQGLTDLKLPGVGKALGLFYAMAMVIGCLGIGNMFQSNQAAAIFITVTGAEQSPFMGKAWLLGLAMAIVVAIVIFGGIKSIARVTEKLVPFMAVLYSVAAIVIIVFNADKLLWAFGAIWQGAFSPDGVTGGIIGVIVIGFRRAVFSNEAGLGSASIAHSAVKTNFPATEGYVALLEPFIDTVVVCTLTALVIITTVYDPLLANTGISGIEMTTRAFQSTISWSPIPLSVAAILFAFSTMLSWSYYGLKAFTYLFGEANITQLIFKFIFCIFIVIGSAIQLNALIDLSDALVFIVAIPNLIGLYILAPIVRAEIEKYSESRKTA